MKVLLVDDDEIFRSLLVLNFQELGFSCLEAANVDEARAVIKKQVPDHVVLDLRMPGASGLTLISDLQEVNSKVRILILTGFASHQTAVEAIKLGAIHYLAKPVEFSEILQAFEKSEGDASVEVSSDHKDLDKFQKDYVLHVLDRFNGNISLAAKELGLHRRTLQRKLQKWGLR